MTTAATKQRHARSLHALQLLNGNSGNGADFRVEQEGDSATLYLYDVIDPFWGVSAERFVKELNGLKASTIHLRINSPGGDVFEARAMATAVSQHASKVIAHVDGLAASAATFLVMAAAEAEAAQGSMLMIHRAWAFVAGNAEELVDFAELLEKIDDAIAGDYTRKTKKSRDQVNQWMRDETWFSAQEALDNGFFDRIAESTQARQMWDVSGAYPGAPEALRPDRAAADLAKQLADALAQQSDTAAVCRHAENLRHLELIEQTCA